jgi:hypothetical protein
MFAPPTPCPGGAVLGASNDFRLALSYWAWRNYKYVNPPGNCRETLSF